MVFVYDGKEYVVEIIFKRNKNTYVRVRDGKIFVTTNYFTSKRSVEKLLKDNYVSVGKMIDRDENRNIKKDLFLLFGKSYDIIYGKVDGKIRLEDGIIRVCDDKELYKWLDKMIETTFYEHLMYWYNKFEENIPIPNLKIRKMKSRWGVCNIKNNNVTLNFQLFRYDIKCLDYVIVHELSHFLEPNHSKNFWDVVNKYYPRYKEIRKMLKD